jgi:hypothetical protein
MCVCVYDSVSIGSADSRHPLNIAPPPTLTTPAAEQDWRVTEVSTVPPHRDLALRTGLTGCRSIPPRAANSLQDFSAGPASLGH